MSEKIKLELVSASQTFVSTFVVELGIALSALPDGTIFNPDFWSTAGVGALLMTVGRSAVKIVWQKFMPIKLGGVKKS